MNVRISLLIITVVLSLYLASFARAAEPMPYTGEALAKLHEAQERYRAPKELTGDDDSKVRGYIDRQRKVFAAAGFDYERSMKRIINDIQFDRYVVNKTTIELNALARELLRLHVKSGINPVKYLGRDFGQLLIDFRDLIRSNMKKYGGC
ncbi:hypothetical protein OR1_02535 [Geobacter sp. OR-1]|uniref:hypothetical protein n=1 Tax=Geobacter sp. OR-1 TaxID=1266765 RepID=UPI000543C5DD|nr:hypothetical protein [Geobacter sp. OR-1]GAM10247.1 hypothetical protein OR1_02535 [Geobacter sp. OR-1]